MRTCENCEKDMSEGFLSEETGETYCSNFCLDIAYPGFSKELEGMTEEELDNSTWYWTTWEEDDLQEEANRERFKESMFTISIKEC